MQSSTEILKLPGKWGKSKWPSLQESYSHFSVDDGKSTIIEGSHDALVDTEACLAVFRGLVEGGHVKLEDCKPKQDKPPTVTPTVDPGSPIVPPSPPPGTPTVDSGSQTLMQSSPPDTPTVDAGTPTLPPSSPPPKPTNNPSVPVSPSDTSPNNLEVANPGELFLESMPGGGGFWVKGNTYKYKDSIKTLGGRWDPSVKAWGFAAKAMPEVRRLVGVPDSE
jgi:hypothetical protein